MKKNSYPGKFIVFEGLDGSGQSTQASRIVNYLNEPKQKLKFGHVGAHLTKEPTSNLIGGLIRSQLNHDWKSSALCLQLLFAADRAHHLEKEIIPLLKRGVTVVCDRYFYSTIAYGGLDIRDFDWLFKINKHFLAPDLTFLLKVSPAVCLSRITKERYEITLFEKEDTLKKVWENFQKIHKRFKNVYIVDGQNSVDKITNDIIKILEKKLR